MNYWASDFLLKSPGAAKISGSPWYCNCNLYTADDFEIEVREAEDSGAGKLAHTIRRADIQQALQIMADKYPWHF